MKKVLAVLLYGFLAATLAFAQVPTTHQAEPGGATPAPAATAAPARPDSPGLIKARLKAYLLQQKAAIKMAKLQTKTTLAGQEYQAATVKGQAKVVAEQAKNQ